MAQMERRSGRPYFNLFVRWANDDEKYELEAGSPDVDDLLRRAEEMMLSGVAGAYVVQTIAIGKGVREP